jgi:hypothetical protein
LGELVAVQSARHGKRQRAYSSTPPELSRSALVDDGRSIPARVVLFSPIDSGREHEEGLESGRMKTSAFRSIAIRINSEGLKALKLLALGVPACWRGQRWAFSGPAVAGPAGQNGVAMRLCQRSNHKNKGRRSAAALFAIAPVSGGKGGTTGARSANQHADIG